MKKPLRKAVFRAKLEAELEKYGRRIQKMAGNAYKIRQVLENLDREAKENAVHISQEQGSVSGGVSDGNTGEPDVHDPAVVEAVLEEQPAKL